MALRHKPDAEFQIDVPLVRRLLDEQCPQRTALPLVALGDGWDNQLFRLGDALVVRLPRRASSAVLVAHEHRWLPQLAARLPVPVPAPIHLGRPGCGYPWPWSITPWLEGECALTVTLREPAAVARTLRAFLTALHRPAPADAPYNPYRSVPLSERLPLLQEHLDRVGSLVDRRAVERVWHRAAAAPRWPAPEVWIHGDLHPGNILVGKRGISAVIDFGDLAAGDPATDWAVAWMLPGVRDMSMPSLDPSLGRSRWTIEAAKAWPLRLPALRPRGPESIGDVERGEHAERLGRFDECIAPRLEVRDRV